LVQTTTYSRNITALTSLQIHTNML